MTNFLFIKSKSKHFKHLGFLLLLFMFSVGVNAQTTVSGIVSDPSGPIPGVNISLKGGKTGVSTNIDGKYTINNVPSGAILVFSFVGYKTQEVSVKGQSQINVSLVDESSTLKEVVVIGYGSTSRSNVTGAISSIGATELERVPLPNAAEALRGQIAGVQVTRSSGQPGSNVSIKIRGTKSLGGTQNSNVDAANQAVIVVDGTPILGGNLSEINPDDIETMTVLKDAASAAIYGASSSNGVVLITTKKGKVGKSEITVNLSTGVANLANKIDFANGIQYVKYLQDATVGGQISNGQPIVVPPVNTLIGTTELANFLAGTDVDWQDLLLRQGLTTNANIAASGGTDTFHYYMNADAYSEEGISVSSDYKRYSYRLNADYSPREWLKIGSRVQLSKSFADETSNVISEFNQNGGFAPFIPISNNTPLGTVYNPDGSYTKFIRPDQFQINPLYRYNESQIDREVTRTIINPYFDVRLGGGFTYTLNASIENRDEFYGKFLSSYYKDGDPNEGTISKATSLSYLVDNIINYKKDFGKHNVTATFVYGVQQFKYEQLQGFSKRLPTDLLGYHALDDALPSDDEVSWNTDESGKAYLVGRVGYSFDNRYIASLSVRRDGSSKFGPNHKYGTFPAGSFAWNAHNESFLKENKTINDLKFRASFGVTGSDNFPTYYYRASTNSVQIPMGGTTIFNGYGVGTTAANPNLKWEESRQFNIGLDFGLFNNRLSGSVDYYQTNNVDLLLFEQINPVVNSGFDRYPSNIGETKTRGLELTLKGTAVKTQDFSWVVSANWSQDKNELVKLSAGDTDANGKPIDNVANGWFIGQDIREIYDYKYIGVWQTTEVADLNANNANVFNAKPGDPKIADINGDKVINDKDRTFLGNPTPDWYGGITNTFNYKGLELSVLFEAVEGVTRINSYYGSYYPASQLSNVINIDYWTPDNPTNAFPRIGVNGGMMGQYANAIKVQDASFVCLRNVSLTYSIPKDFLKRTFIKDLSFSVRGNNLKYFTDYNDAFSPESGSGSYPITKTWTFGTKLTF
ncbi:TonB-linked outer membrane protein, SusC/RagA family [Flavobacterium fluvii]|uniref:TonB-linked outer membrane protein, SusC/RagA family n=1 Tax=Flavobacterium fluvii TaxID=468056 RepID=A0A1M5FV59_9FLAO|nr:TonB-dependent receptor [Flavobacterium fluvii]SHF95373.1 TonB-linked outer membrane protein, SusC/RagA family [Flavobacterium fluvii]